jgi:hypothetical protein
MHPQIWCRQQSCKPYLMLMIQGSLAASMTTDLRGKGCTDRACRNPCIVAELRVMCSGGKGQMRCLCAAAKHGVQYAPMPQPIAGACSSSSTYTWLAMCTCQQDFAQLDSIQGHALPLVRLVEVRTVLSMLRACASVTAAKRACNLTGVNCCSAASLSIGG